MPTTRSPLDPQSRPAIGWREWVALPGLGIPRIKAKIDTGARTSSLHAYNLRTEIVDGKPTARFVIHPEQRGTRVGVETLATIIDEREIRNSGGRTELRPVVLATCALMGQEWPIELTLSRRDEMGFRLLLGRQAIRGRFVVDPGRSFLGEPRPKKNRRKSATSRKGEP